MNWLWLNIPLMATFFVAMTSIPLWLVFKHPDTGPAAPAGAGPQQFPRPAADAARARELIGAAR